MSNAEYHRSKNEQEARLSAAACVQCKGSGSSLEDNRPDSVIQQKQITGQNGSAEKVVQLVTRINHTTSNFTYTHLGANVTEPVGVDMNARLDPTDPVAGSATQAGGPQANLIARMNVLYGNMVRGHLLNHDLGGFGVSNNLFPITTAANNQHKFKVEYGVKAALTNARANHLAGNQPDGVFYSVEVDSGMNETKLANGSDFVCHAHYLNNINGATTRGANIVDVTVNSFPNPAAPAAGGAYDTNTGLVPLNFPAAGATPGGWAHAGTGTRHGAFGAELGPAGHIQSNHQNSYLTWLKMQTNRGLRIASRHKGAVIAGGVALAAGGLGLARHYGWI